LARAPAQAPVVEQVLEQVPAVRSPRRQRVLPGRAESNPAAGRTPCWDRQTASVRPQRAEVPARAQGLVRRLVATAEPEAVVVAERVTPLAPEVARWSWRPSSLQARRSPSRLPVWP
jgi:hypothetical protein